MGIKVSSSSIPKVADIPGLSEALDLFTDKKGREIRDWATDSLDDRIEKVTSICVGAGTSLAGSKFSIYRHSSELLHGTYFGVIFFWTSPSGERLDRAEYEKHWVQSHLATVFTASFFGVLGVIECCASRFGLKQYEEPVRQMISKARELVDPEASA